MLTRVGWATVFSLSTLGCTGDSARLPEVESIGSASEQTGKTDALNVDLASGEEQRAKKRQLGTGGKAVNKLRLTLWFAEVSLRVGEDVNGIVRLENVGDFPILVLPEILNPSISSLFDVVGPDKKRIPYTGPERDWVPDYDKAVVKLAPSEVIDKKVNLATRRTRGYDLQSPGAYQVTAQYSWNFAEPPTTVYRGRWERGAIWTGTVRSNSVTIMLTR